MSAAFTEDSARAWLQVHAGEYVCECGEHDPVGLATACATAFDVDHDGGPLDTTGHWLWSLVAGAVPA